MHPLLTPLLPMALAALFATHTTAAAAEDSCPAAIGCFTGTEPTPESTTDRTEPAMDPAEAPATDSGAEPATDSDEAPTTDSDEAPTTDSGAGSATDSDAAPTPEFALNSAAGPALESAASSPAGVVAARAALGMIGVPYSWGGGGVRGPGFGIGKGARTWGFDCSGLAEYAWARAGAEIGTTTHEQWRSGVRIPKEYVQPGDLIFYDSKPNSPGPEHVGIALDTTRIVHAPHTGQVVRIEGLERRTLMGVVRPTQRVTGVPQVGAGKDEKYAAARRKTAERGGTRSPR